MQVEPQPCNILVVDDNAFDLSVLKELAETAVETDRVACARSLDEAVDRVSDLQPVLVILDDYLGPVTRAPESVVRLRQAGYANLICVATARHDRANAGPLLRNAGVLYFDKDGIDGEWLNRMIYLARHNGALWSIRAA
ncbi:MAG: hypothetical protein RLZ98_1951 [Pseudomonadota bacterium]|jgi:CheY-like chemotaxis protein